MSRSLLIAGACLGALTAAVPALAEAPSLAQRYADFDAYAPDKLRDMVVDLDVNASFADGGVLFHRGPRGAGKVLLADPTSARETVLVEDVALAEKLKAAGTPVKTSADVRIIGYEAGALKLTTGGEAWLYDIAKAEARRAPAEAPSRAGLSPDGKYKVLARNYNLYVVEVATGRETPLTADGDYDRRYGTYYPLLGDMAAANSETPDMPLDAQWSPDSTRILSYRLLRNGTYIWHTVQQNPPGSRFPREFSFVYPTAGAKDVPREEPIVIDVAATLKQGHPVINDLKVPAVDVLYPGDPDLGWDGSRVSYQWTKRGYGEIDLYDIDPVSGDATLRVHEAVKPVVTVTSSFIRNAPELNGYLSVSERTGWAQLYYIRKGDDPSGGKALTKGNWEIAEVTRIGEKDVLITGTGREPGVNPYFHSLYRVGLDASIANLTPEPLDHRTTVSDDGKWIIDAMSSPIVPTRTVIRDAKDGHIVQELGKADPSALMATGFTPPEPFQTLADDGKTMLYGMLYRPRHFDPSRTYPVIENLYTGPTTHRTSEAYDGNVVASVNALAQIGAIVVTIDGRGTSQRGQAFRLPAFQNLGEVGIDDHIWVLKAMQKKYPYMDLDRVGVFGGSAGGYDAARFILRRPNFYKVSVAQSGNHDLRLDKAWWPEVSMGLADDATWERNSNISVAGNLKGKLMLIHGDLDDNVPVTASLRLSQALQAAGKDHELVIVPNWRHNVGASPVYRQKLRDFFVKNLLNETPPAS